MSKELRLMYSSNAPWSNSGYGVQSRSLLPRLAQLPEFNGIDNIAMFAWYGLAGGMMDLNGLRCYPAGADPYGNDVVQAHMNDFQANILVSLIDVWVMRDTAKKIAPALWLPWLPIDHDPVPMPVLEALKDAFMPLTYSKWGRDMLANAGVANTYIPHGVETNIYRVLEDREAVKVFKNNVLLCDQDTHLSIMVAANKGFPDRKAFQVQIRAWANFAKDKPKAKLYLHTEPTTMYGGIDLPALCANLGITDKVIFPDRYQLFKGLPAEFMAMLYNAADVYLGNSMAEGFGIPIIEAQACGTPVIVTNFSSMPELVRWGFKIEPADMFWTPMNAWQAWPDVRGITDALNLLYETWAENKNQLPEHAQKRAEQMIHSEFSWDSIVRDNWTPLITNLGKKYVIQDVQESPAAVKTIERKVSSGIVEVK